MGGCVGVAARARRENRDLGSGRSCFRENAEGETLGPRLDHLWLLCLISHLCEAWRRRPAHPGHTSLGDRVSAAPFSGLTVCPALLLRLSLCFPLRLHKAFVQQEILHLLSQVNF